MRHAMIALLLCGCAWGQSGTGVTTVVRSYPSGDGCNTTYEYSNGVTASTLAYCTKSPIENAVPIKPDPPIDIPAKNEPSESTPYMRGDMTSCSNGGSVVMGKGGFPVTSIGEGWQCKGGHVMGCSFDKDRILIGPDGHGKYWCHLPQTDAK